MQTSQSLWMNLLLRCREKGIGYWIFWVFSVGLSFWLGPRLERWEPFQPLRYSASHFVDELIPRAARPKSTVLIEVRDAEFWGRNQGRVPISRDLLASIVSAVAYYRPPVIAIDFDLSSPDPSLPQLDFPAYRKENENLLTALSNAAKTSKLVLPLRLAAHDGPTQSPECSGLVDVIPTPFAAAQVGSNSWGYLNVNDDVRKLPLDGYFCAGGKKVAYASFSTAIAQAQSATLGYKYLEGQSEPLTNFIAAKDFEEGQRRFAASAILASIESVPASALALGFSRDTATLAQSSLWSKLRSSAVVIGAQYHRDGPGRGQFVDLHDTPTGQIPGHELHANYVESLLDDRAKWAVNPYLLKAIKLAVTIVLTFVLISHMPDLVKSAWLLGSLIALFLLAYLGSLALGLFVETVLPAVLIAGHFVVDMILDWYQEAAEARHHHA